MAAQQAKIMIVDDTPDNIMLLRMILEDDFELSEAHNGSECLDVVQNDRPDLILLDVDMPDMTGYEVCRKLKQNPATSTIPIIFVSAMDLPEQRLEGFEAGGDEYIVKPVDAELLLQKINATLEVCASHKKLERDAREAMSAALEAMTASSEMGALIQFMKQSNNCKEMAELANFIIKSIQHLGLAACVMIIDADKPNFYGCNVQSLEARALAKCQQAHRIYDFGARTVFSDEHVAILIKNMPLDEPSRYGRVKDNILVLVSMANSRLKAMRMEMELSGQRSDFIKSLIQIAEEKLQVVNGKIIQHEKNVENIMQDMVGKLEDKLIFLGLEEDQETALRRLAFDASEDIQRLGAVSDDLNTALGEILEGLYRLLEK